MAVISDVLTDSAGPRAHRHQGPENNGYDAAVADSSIRRIDEVYTHIYTFPMSSRAKLFQNGGSQAVRLPKECRFPENDNEVIARREGRRVILEPVDEWPADFVQSLGAWKGVIPRPKQQGLRKLKDPFGS